MFTDRLYRQHCSAGQPIPSPPGSPRPGKYSEAHLRLTPAAWPPSRPAFLCAVVQNPRQASEIPKDSAGLSEADHYNRLPKPDTLRVGQSQFSSRRSRGTNRCANVRWPLMSHASEQVIPYRLRTCRAVFVVEWQARPRDCRLLGFRRGTCAQSHPKLNQSWVSRPHPSRAPSSSTSDPLNAAGKGGSNCQLGRAYVRDHRYQLFLLSLGETSEPRRRTTSRSRASRRAGRPSRALSGSASARR